MARAPTRPSAPAGKGKVSRAGGVVGADLGSGARVRPFRPADLQRLRELRHQADRLHARLLPSFFRAPRDRSQPALERDAASEILVVDGPDGVAGYVQVRIVDTPAHPAMTPARRAHVETLVVDEALRRRGLGTRLMRAAGRWAAGRGAIELLLTVWSENAEADGFYRALGYRAVAQVLRKNVEEADAP